MTTKTHAMSKNGNNKKNKKDAKNAASEALDNPNLTRSANTSEMDDEATSSRGVEVVAPTIAQGDETCLHTHLVKAIASNVGITSPMLVSTPMLGGEATLISFGRDETREDVGRMQLGENTPQGMSTPTREARRQEKKPERSTTEHPYAWWKDVLTRVQASGPGAGYTMNDWNMMVRWLGTVPRIEGTGTLVEKARGLLPPMGYTEWEWKVFLDQAEVEMVKGGDFIVEGTSLIEVKQELIPLTPNTLKRAEESLTMPRQPEESKFGSRTTTQGIGEIKKSS